MFICSLGIGLITPTSMAGALKFFPENAGQSSAMAVFIRFVVAMIISSLFAFIEVNIIFIFAMLIIFCSAINFLAIYSLRKRSISPPQ
jgi:hypothetical protein